MRMHGSLFLLFLLFIFLLISISNNLYALEPVQRPDIIKEAEIVSVQGDGWVRFIKGKDWLDAVYSQLLTSGDSLKTGMLGRMSILFIDETQIKIHNKTMLVIKDVKKTPEKGTTVLRLEVGEVWSRAKKVPEGLRIETPSATAAIRGTDWDILVDDKGTSYLTVLRGSVEFYNDYGKIMVQTGEQASAAIGKPPVKTFLVSPKERVQWIVVYNFDVVKFIPFYSYRRQEVIKVLPSAQEAVIKDSGNLQSKLFLAGLLFDLKEKKESLKLFDEVLEKDPKNTRALTFRGLLELDKGDPDKAASYFEQSLKSSKKGEDIEPLIGMVGVYLQKNNLEKAAGLIEEINKTRPSILSDIIIVLFQAYKGDFTKAISLCELDFKNYPDQEIFPTLIAHFYLVIDEPEKAKEWIDKAAAINPDYSHVHAFLGEYYYIEGKGIEAEDSLKKSLEIDPKNDIALDILGLIMLDKGNYEEALKIFTEAIDIYPRDSVLWANRALTFAGVENIDKAHDDYSVASELDPNNFETFKGLGYIALAEGKTAEAVELFLKSSLMEPQYASPHIYLAIAYYQQGDIARALDELKLAEQLDPRDPLPHIVAQIIYQDIYRASDAVYEATKALELLPYLKSVVPIENTKSALADLGAALLYFDLADWAWSYSQESYDPQNATSHFFASLQYSNPIISLSEFITGLALDPLSVSSPTRYQDIIRKPRNDVTFSVQIGSEDGGFSQSYDATFQGYFRKPFDTSYYFSLSKFDNDGFRENGYSEGHSLFYGIGIKPDYKNGFYTYGWISESKSGDPGYITNPDPDDRNELRSSHISLGYNHRFGYRNNLLARFAYQKIETEFLNPAPFGTGLSDIVLSFIQEFGINTTRGFFQKGVYDISEIIPGPNISLVTDSTGEVADAGFPLLTDTVPSYIDDDPIHRYATEDEVLAFQTRHLFDIGNNHQISYGIEYVPDSVSISLLYNTLHASGEIDFCDEIFSESPECSPFSQYATSANSLSASDTYKFFTAYLHDRWRITDNILVEGGLFYKSMRNENDYSGIHPQIGLALSSGKHILRIGFQKWLEPPSTGTLAPVSVAGLFVDNRLTLFGARMNDYQARLESRWTDKFFTSVWAERVELNDTADPLAPVSHGRTNSFSVAINSILTKSTGFVLRYTYTDSMNEDIPYRGNDIPLISQHMMNVGIVWVSPLHIKSSLNASYVGRRYSDIENQYLLSDYVTADFSLIWEPFKKHAFLNLTIKNIFDKRYETYREYPAAGRSVFLTAEYRF